MGVAAAAVVVQKTSHTTQAARPQGQGPVSVGEGGAGRPASVVGLRPSKLSANGRTHWYQVPPNAKGLVVVFPGCSRRGPGFWPASTCSECLGFPQDVSHTKQILRKGYAILVLTPVDQQVWCWSQSRSDHVQAVPTITTFIQRNGLTGKPVYFLGGSSGAGLMVRMQDYLATLHLPWRVSGIVSEVGTNSDVGKSRFPPTVWVVMQRDTSSQREAAAHVSSLKARGIPAAFVVSPSRVITPTFFSEQIVSITPQQSSAITAALKKLGVINAGGAFVKDPKSNMGLVAQVQKLVGFKFPVVFRDSAVWQALTYAYAQHEHVATYTTAALTWFEGGCRASFPSLCAQLAVNSPASF